MDKDYSVASSADRLQCSGTDTQAIDHPVKIQVCPSTGGQFEITVNSEDTIELLKRSVAKKLKVSREKINLLHKERTLKEGTLRTNNICDGSKLSLVPQVETGLVSQRPDQTVMNALENLSDNQVNDFLAGKSPLTLAMRLGDHMMFVQLQLSTPPNKRHKKKSSKSRSSNVTSITSGTTSATNGTTSATAGQSFTPCDNALQTNATKLDSTASVDRKAQPVATRAPSIPPIADIHLPTLDSTALSEATRNLSKRLKELSKITAQKEPASTEDVAAPSTAAGKKSSGAIIESMQHHGQGVYSGTFSGTLNPALQDSEGKPKKSLSTIIHILNDLLGAQPQYRAHLQRKKKKVPTATLR